MGKAGSKEEDDDDYSNDFAGDEDYETPPSQMTGGRSNNLSS